MNKEILQLAWVYNDLIEQFSLHLLQHFYVLSSCTEKLELEGYLKRIRERLIKKKIREGVGGRKRGKYGRRRRREKSEEENKRERMKVWERGGW